MWMPQAVEHVEGAGDALGVCKYGAGLRSRFCRRHLSKQRHSLKVHSVLGICWSRFDDDARTMH